VKADANIVFGALYGDAITLTKSTPPPSEFETLPRITDCAIEVAAVAHKDINIASRFAIFAYSEI